ncbi:hypothetical protein H4219_001280 [Mycoemilia scoparia]|uniref:Protein YOP1 n=1 Tax=Mycoemilia scoparia TaxID=417184 RepID=A0A9W8A694_9FUNG|nr:hypothetical protein H4219_001280 [Mycoemilia scoparia]
MLFYISKLLCLTVGYAIPGYRLYKDLKGNTTVWNLRTGARLLNSARSKEATTDPIRAYLEYWTVMACFTIAEFFADTFIFWQGARVLYYKVIQPFVSEHEEELDQWLEHADKVAQQPSEALNPQNWSNSLSKLQNMMSSPSKQTQDPQQEQGAIGQKLFGIAQGFLSAVAPQGSRYESEAGANRREPAASSGQPPSFWDRIKFQEPTIEPSNSVQAAASMIASMIASGDSEHNTNDGSGQANSEPRDLLHNEKVQRALAEAEVFFGTPSAPKKEKQSQGTPNENGDFIDEDTVLVERSKSQSSVDSNNSAEKRLTEQQQQQQRKKGWLW